MKDCAVFTIVKNEKLFLPIWIKHYKKFFDNYDIYILDHESNDDSTKNLDVNVIPIYNEFTFDQNWLISTVQNFQCELLKNYKAVLFAEGDELIYTLDKPLNEIINLFINDETVNYQTCNGYEIIQNLETEKSLSENDEIIKNRNYWYYSPQYYCKTLLSKIPLNWHYGFHETTSSQRDYKYNLFLCHLHKYDFEQMLFRHQERALKWKYHSDVTERGLSWHNYISEKDKILELFNTTHGYPIIEIPENHKLSLNHI